MRFDGQVAVVTGGGGGIGGATARMLASQGATVVVADLVEASAARVADEIRAAGGQAEPLAVDLTDYAALERAANEVVARHGRIDVLANVAGGSAGPVVQTTPQRFAESDPKRWEEMIRLNLLTTMNATRAVVNHMIARKAGRIVNVSSLAGVLGGTQLVDYSAAKGAVLVFSMALAKELAPHGIRVNTIAPGTVGTERVLGLPRETRDWYLEGIRLGRFGTADEMAHSIVFLASDASSYITGQNITVDGGWGLGPSNF